MTASAQMNNRPSMMAKCSFMLLWFISALLTESSRACFTAVPSHLLICTTSSSLAGAASPSAFLDFVILGCF
uniref:Putative secreted peptide n=1 Tax=Anopheles braziliensis TaxID=58242 RepID=A0A2M3ZMK8_9DIPT